MISILGFIAWTFMVFFAPIIIVKGVYKYKIPYIYIAIFLTGVIIVLVSLIFN